MAHEINTLNDGPAPVILTVPGLCNSGPGHWQTLWEAQLPRCRRVDLGLWEDPHRNTWVNKLNLAIQRAEGPVVLAAHSLGCLAVAWWAEYEQPGGPVDGGKVIGALLVAPPDVEERPLDRRLTRFAPVPEAALPFPSVLVASRNDPYLTMAQARGLARRWVCASPTRGRRGISMPPPILATGRSGACCSTPCCRSRCRWCRRCRARFRRRGMNSIRRSSGSAPDQISGPSTPGPA